MALEQFEYTEANILEEFTKIQESLEESGVASPLIYDALNMENNPYVNIEGINHQEVLKNLPSEYRNLFQKVLGENTNSTIILRDEVIDLLQKNKNYKEEEFLKVINPDFRVSNGESNNESRLYNGGFVL